MTDQERESLTALTQFIEMNSISMYNGAYFRSSVEITLLNSVTTHETSTQIYLLGDNPGTLDFHDINAKKFPTHHKARYQLMELDRMGYLHVSGTHPTHGAYHIVVRPH